MSDFYNIDKVHQQSNQLQKDKDNQLQKDNKQLQKDQTNDNDDTSILQEAQRIEQQNYDEAHKIKQNLNQAHLNQKGATSEMKRQTETLTNTRKSAYNVTEEAQRGEDLADDIDREGRIFSCRFACIDNIYKWFRRVTTRRRASADINDVKDNDNNKEEEDTINEEYQTNEEFVPGQNKTDKELIGVLNTVRGIRQQAEVQSNEAKKQKVVIGDIGVANEESEKVIKRTDEHLKKLD